MTQVPTPNRSGAFAGMPGLPCVLPFARRILQLLRSSGDRRAELVDLILADPGLTLRIMARAQRAFGLPGLEIRTVTAALDVLGKECLIEEVSEAIRLARTAGLDVGDHVAQLKTALVVSLLCESLAHILEIVDPESARVGGLLYTAAQLSSEARPGLGDASRQTQPPILTELLAYDAWSDRSAETGRRESEVVLTTVLRLAECLACDLGVLDLSPEIRASEFGQQLRVRQLTELVVERATQELDDSLLVLGVLLGIPRLRLPDIEKVITGLMLQESTLDHELPPPGISRQVAQGLVGIQEAPSEAACVEHYLEALRSCAGVQAALLVLDDPGAAMMRSSDERQPFHVALCDFEVSVDGLPRLMEQMREDQQPRVVKRQMGFDGLLVVLGCVEVLAVPLMAAERMIGAVFISCAQAVPEALTAMSGLLARHAGQKIERLQLQDKSFLLSERITKDKLTGVLQRAHLQDRMDAEVRRANRYRSALAVVFIDVDEFKAWNDTYGHQVGDRLLRDIARVLMDCSREDDLVGRYGGDEFLVVLPGQNVEQAQSFAERVRERVSTMGKIMRETCYELNLSVSLGVASISNYPADAKTLIFRADHALYQAKERGRNRVHAELV